MENKDQGRDVDQVNLDRIMAQLPQLPLGYRLKALRVLFGITMDGLSARLDITRQHLNKVERGEQVPGQTTMGNLRDFLGADLNLLYDTLKRTRKE